MHTLLRRGSSLPAPEGSTYSYPEEHRLPLGRGFSQALAEKSGFTEQFPKDSIGNLQRVSLFYETKLGRNNLVNEIRNAVMYGKKPSPVVRALARLNFPLVITTNYDQLFEAERDKKAAQDAKERAEQDKHQVEVERDSALRDKKGASMEIQVLEQANSELTTKLNKLTDAYNTKASDLNNIKQNLIDANAGLRRAEEEGAAAQAQANTLKRAYEDLAKKCGGKKAVQQTVKP